MSHYYLFFAVLVLSIALSIYGAYLKGCRDTWRAADEIIQAEAIFPAEEAEPQNSPLYWPEMVFTTNCRECQDESEQTL